MSDFNGQQQRGDRDVTRKALLGAAGRIVQRDGVTRLTIDAVAAESGVSKGGVLYHFRTKDALIAAFVDGVAEAFEADFARMTVEEQGSGSLAALRGYVRASTMPDPVPHLTAGLIAALAWRPELGQLVRNRFTGWHARAREGVPDQVLARTICLAADGVWLSACFGYGLHDEGDREAISTRLLRLADQAGQPLTQED
ncbi:MAG TPA: TetR/AcrR family transcriptional regulator [Thermomicrobiales bacterium]|nr:TetR/AcrR family transcriptional regulator [Thermomicrobiales bacterium]